MTEGRFVTRRYLALAAVHFALTLFCVLALPWVLLPFAAPGGGAGPVDAILSAVVIFVMLPLLSVFALIIQAAMPSEGALYLGAFILAALANSLVATLFLYAVWLAVRYLDKVSSTW